MKQETSLLAYTQLSNLGERQKAVFDCIKQNKGLTDLEISRKMGFADPNQVRPRRNELCKMGLIKEKGKKICNISGKIALIWGVA